MNQREVPAVPFTMLADLFGHPPPNHLVAPPTHGFSSAPLLNEELSNVGRWSCPHCQQPLSCGEVEGYAAVHCPEFHGMLLDMRSLGELIERLRAQYSGPEQIPQPLDPKELEHQRRCPKCQEMMEVHPYNGPGNAVIDSCARCRVVWLDDGETTRIVRAPGRRHHRSW